jgi:hypothetical protein
MSTVHGSAGTQHIKVTWLLNLLSKTTPNSVDKAMVGEDDNVESVRSDIPYNVGSHLKSTANTAVARFEEIRTGFSAEARREALAIRYQPPLRGSKVYTQREMKEAPGFIHHLLAP